jgi:hypothetical protein
VSGGVLNLPPEPGALWSKGKAELHKKISPCKLKSRKIRKEKEMDEKVNKKETE